MAFSGPGANAQAPSTGSRPRIITESFKGFGADKARSSVMGSLKRDPTLDVIADDQIVASARRLGIQKMTAMDHKRLAKDLRAVAYVRGEVVKYATYKNPWEIRIDVCSPEDGSVISSTTWTTTKLDMNTPLDRKVYKKVRADIILVAPIATAPPPRPYVPKTVAAPVVAAPAWDHKTPIGPHSAVTTPTPIAVSKPPATMYTSFEDMEEVTKPRIRELYPPEGLSFSLGAGTIHRSMSALLSVYSRDRPGGAANKSAIIPEQRDYQTGGMGAPELALSAEFYPGVIWDIPWLKPFGLVADFHRTIFTDSKGCPKSTTTRNGGDCAQEQKISIATREYEIYVGARGKFRVGDIAQPLWLLFDLGFDQFVFDLKPDQLQQVEYSDVIPPLAYNTIHTGARVQYSIVPRFFTIEASGGYRFGLGSPDYRFVWGGYAVTPGQELTGAPWGMTFGAAIISEAPYIFEGAFFRFAFDWFQYTTTFRGQAACVASAAACAKENNPADPTPDYQKQQPWETFPTTTAGYVDPSDPTKPGGVRDPVKDTYMRFNLSFGWKFR